jgi:hypothetical protein
MGIKKGKCRDLPLSVQGDLYMSLQVNNSITLIPTKVPYIKTVKLELGCSMKPKFIGHINERVKIFRTKRNDSQIHHKTNSIAFNHSLVHQYDIDIFQVEYNGKFLYITTEYLLKVGKEFQYAQGKTELQIFCPLREFSSSIEGAKGKNDTQFSLFS